MLKLFERPTEMIREVNLFKQKVKCAIVTDACPKGWGAVLALVRGGLMSPRPVEAVEARVTEEEALLLDIKYEEAASQAVLEAYAVLRAIEKWGTTLAGTSLVIKSSLTPRSPWLCEQRQRVPQLHSCGDSVAPGEIQGAAYSAASCARRGQLNVEADYFSRLADRGDKPLPEGQRSSN